MKGLIKRQWPLIGLGVLLVIVAFYLIRGGKEIIRGPIVKYFVSGEGLKLKDIHYTHNDPDEGMRWILDATEVRFSEDKSSIFFRNFRLRVEPENRAFFRMKGKKGDYSRDSGEIKLWGALEGYSDDGYRIVTEYMLINEKTRHLSTNKPVKIFGPFFSVQGLGLFVDFEKETLKVLSDAITRIDKESLT